MFKNDQTVVSSMKGRSILGYFLALFAIGSLELAPMVRPAMAMPTTMHASLGESMAASMVPTASDDMPCCPGTPSVPDCGKDCPFMALCGAAPLYFVSQTSLIVPLTVVSIIFPGDPSDLVSVARAPPRKPPKT
jgi:hypothetical protein